MNPEDALEIVQALNGSDEQEDVMGWDGKSEQPDVNKPTDGLSKKEQGDIVDKALARFRIASYGTDHWHKLWRVLDLFDRADQWHGVQIPVWIPKPVTNLIRFIRTTKRANLAQAIPQANMTPLTPLDAGLVMKLQKAYEHVWDEEKVPMTIRRTIDRASLLGTQICYVYAEENIRGKWFGDKNPNNQLHRYDIKVKRMNNAQFYIDPSAYNLQEAKYITVTENLNLKDVKNNPLFKEYAGANLANLKSSDLERDLDAVGDIYQRPTNKLEQSLVHVTGDDMVTMHVHWERFRNKEGAWQVDVSYFLWGTDFLLYRIEDFKPSVYPFAVYYDEEEDNSFWGTSGAMDILENQKVINKTSQAASIIGTLHQNPQKIVLKESGINAAEMSRTGTLAGKVWTSNIPNAVETIQPPDIPNGLFEIEDRMKADIKDMMGINEAYAGQSVGSLTTSTGVDSLIERATLRDRDKMLQIDRFVEDLSDILVKFILVYWREPRPIMTRALNGQAQYEQWTPVDPDIIENLEYRIHSNVYAKAPVTQASRSQQADNLMQMQGQFQFDPPVITPEEWIMLKDFPNKEDILARMQADRNNKQNQEVQQMTSQIIQLIQQADQMRGQGAQEDQVIQQLQGQVQQIVQQTFTAGTNQNTANQMADTGMAGETAPKVGTTGPTQLANMTQG